MEASSSREIEMEIDDPDNEVGIRIRIMLSRMLEVAYHDCFSNKFKIKSKAMGWVFSNSQEEWSYLWVCSNLFMKQLPEKLRQAILDGKKASTATRFTKRKY